MTDTTYVDAIRIQQAAEAKVQVLKAELEEAKKELYQARITVRDFKVS